MRVEWDADKASKNFAKHGVSFDEAMEVFSDPHALENYDARHSISETRFFMIGLSSRRLLFVVFTEVASHIVRLISARKATKVERELYEGRVTN
jgi:uncharacterized DUF497 family protein